MGLRCKRFKSFKRAASGLRPEARSHKAAQVFGGAKRDAAWNLFRNLFKAAVLFSLLKANGTFAVRFRGRPDQSEDGVKFLAMCKEA